ncbi:hypothetical protein PSSM7_150 [Prochlorococcus phage P-SSM7]|uniref:Uncharacterized protein n=1 Tax=Prochlorococcus phage P-SSM7 TaxID=445688 RepID=E3SNR4_9CAUD|nr:hypothetical protein PSSM7_150 [Prochlorococcus phage P-SSM7]ADO98957.1 hypothetical protein PSSM7_150 [Prochlorococcus phage P-SSM7]
MTQKIDTQGMSGEAVEGCKDNVYPRDENGEPIYPPMDIKPLTLIEPKLKEELKALINEVLDEREYQKKLNGPYDMPEYSYRLDELQE